jgi:pimeloyl-ACP methyl ester carboxylesterase
VRDVLAVLDAAGLQRVIVIGTSLGGIVGMLLASLHRTRTAGLVLNDIGPALEVAGMLRIASSAGTARTVTTWTEAAADARAANAAVYPDFTDADWMTFARRVYREDSPGRIIRDVDPNVGRAVREPAGVPTGAVPDFWGAFDALDGLPLLCLRGELSDLLSAATVARMAERHAGMKSIEIPRRGHAPTLDEPESRAAIDAFIKQL